MQKIKKIKISLKQRLVIITFSTVLMTALTVFILSQQIFGGFIKQRFFDRLNLLSRHLASGVVLGLILKDKEVLSQFARSMTKEESIVAVEVLTKDKKQLLLIGNPKKADGFLEEIVISGRSQEPFHEENVLGYVRLYYSTKVLDYLLHQLFWRVLFVSLVLALLMSLMGYFLITKALIRPLNELRLAVKKVEKGDLSLKVSGQGLPETEELAQAFSNMIASLRQSREELKKTYEKMLHSRYMAEIGQFSLTIAHEIKNPLGIIKGSLDILRKPEVSEEIRHEMIRYIEEEIQRLDQLIQNFLSFARPPQIKPRPISPREIIISLARRTSLEYGKERITYQSVSDLPLVSLDPEQLERAILNLIKNAFEAGAQQVELSVYKEGNYIIFQIKDNGPGIPGNQLSQIFQPFYTTKAKGSGLGLCIVQQIVKAHDGLIVIEKNHPQGTIFKLIFKISQEGS